MAENDVQDLQQSMNRFREPAMALVAGAGAAVVVATLPHVYLESIIGATGVAEFVPAAAPPLGNTARMLIAAAAGLVSASAVYFFLNRKGDAEMGVALREQINAASPIELEPEIEAKSSKRRFALPKLNLNKKSLTSFLKKPKKSSGRVMDLADLPQLRDADRHPDAPARRPIFADADLGAPLQDTVPPFDASAFREPPAADAAPVVEPPVADAVAAEPVMAMEAETPAAALAVAPETVSQAPAPKEDLSGLNIAQLTDRLEAGLTRLKELEAASFAAATVADSAPSAANSAAPEAPVHTPPQLKSVDVSPEDAQAKQQADMDAALKAALGTLEKMTAQR